MILEDVFRCPFKDIFHELAIVNNSTGGPSCGADYKIFCKDLSAVVLPAVRSEPTEGQADDEPGPPTLRTMDEVLHYLMHCICDDCAAKSANFCGNPKRTFAEAQKELRPVGGGGGGGAGRPPRPPPPPPAPPPPPPPPAR
jgi:hypothetical protein